VGSAGVLQAGRHAVDGEQQPPLQLLAAGPVDAAVLDLLARGPRRKCSSPRNCGARCAGPAA
jgi:hypothetical protein